MRTHLLQDLMFDMYYSTLFMNETALTRSNLRVFQVIQCALHTRIPL